jgi:hypothetical protein
MALASDTIQDNRTDDETSNLRLDSGMRPVRFAIFRFRGKKPAADREVRPTKAGARLGSVEIFLAAGVAFRGVRRSSVGSFCNTGISGRIFPALKQRVRRTSRRRGLACPLEWSAARGHKKELFAPSSPRTPRGSRTPNFLEGRGRAETVMKKSVILLNLRIPRAK